MQRGVRPGAYTEATGWPGMQGGEHAAATNLEGTALARDVFGLRICIRVRPACKRSDARAKKLPGSRRSQKPNCSQTNNPAENWHGLRPFDEAEDSASMQKRKEDSERFT